MWLCVVVTPTLQVEGVFGFQRVSVSDTCDYIPLFYFQKLLPVSMSRPMFVYGVVFVCFVFVCVMMVEGYSMIVCVLMVLTFDHVDNPY
jgi:hypothetical protein